MPWWYYDKKELRNTPSVKDGIDYEVECQSRKEGARFIFDTGNEMALGYNTMATGIVYFHRFYMVHSFSSFPKYLTACCALFLAGKVEETPKKAKDIIKLAEKCLPSDEFAKFGEDPKEELLILERILLQSIKFDLQVDHPYAFLLKYAKSLRGVASEQKKMEDVLQMAWTFVNDSLCTTLCLQWEPEVIAVAMLYLAAKLSKYEIINWAGKTANQTRWWEIFVNGVTLDLLEDICHQALDLYSQKRSASSSNSHSIDSTAGTGTVSNNNNNNNSNNNNNNNNNNSISTNNTMQPKGAAPNTKTGQRLVVTDATIGPSLLPSNPVLSAIISNPLSNINTITSMYRPHPIITQPPPLYSAPPPPLLMNPPIHDGNAAGIYAIPTHYTSASNQYNSFGPYGPAFQ